MVERVKYRALLLYGPPGSGKGTQGRALGTLPGFLHVATGDIFRGLDPASPLGQQVGAITSQGKLAPDDLTIEVCRVHIATMRNQKRFDPQAQVLVLDGIPRTRRQAELLQPYLDVLCIFNLILRHENEAVQRIRQRFLQENRHDDANEGVIRQRLATFYKQTEQTLTVYEPTLVVDIDASQSPQCVLRDIITATCRATS